MWRRNKLQATILSFANSEHIICCLYYSPTPAERHPTTRLHQERGMFPSVPAPGLFTCFPPGCGCATEASAPACLQQLVTPGWLIQTLPDFSQVRGTVTTILLNCSSQLSWFRLKLVWFRLKLAQTAQWQHQGEWPLQTAQAQLKGTVSPNTPALAGVAGRSRSGATAPGTGCSLPPTATPWMLPYTLCKWQ